MHRAFAVMGLTTAVCAAMPCQADEPPLRFSISESWSMPLVHIVNGQVDGGILYDLMISLSQQADREAQFRLLPRTRIQAAVDNNEIDVRCYAAQAWLANRMSGDYTWSIPLMTQRDVLVSRDAPGTRITLDQLALQNIGTVHGYTYPPLDPYFDANKLERDDARNQDQALQKLIAGRYRYAVTNEWALEWFNRTHAANEQLSPVATLEEQAVGCIARNDPAVPAQRIMRVLLRMKMSGEVDRIIAKYR